LLCLKHDKVDCSQGGQGGADEDDCICCIESMIYGFPSVLGCACGCSYDSVHATSLFLLLVLATVLVLLFGRVMGVKLTTRVVV